ncbi:serine/threonine-protein kinase [Streptomyces candidus]|uniref:non-specific serine/threonine protein kinase n=1 Tax=Streptomyces candidus TaxID=67283 RepID=A0A7X0HF13_9ACTN|nr:serine/threonine-protein kinase [Streptomyces candidus]MBB6434978.1 tRNA A-37 threonylcarbamoyl transferase component Bud32 [Streptomyces candidus]
MANGSGGEAGSGTTAGQLLAGRYRLGDVLGSGGMGRVWRARDEVLHRTVAIKELRAGLYAAEADRALLHARTQKEARAAARINHPGVVTVHDVLDHDDRPWIVMEYVDGPSLADALKETGPCDAREAARIGLHVLGALRAAHAVGVLHRDVKPGNVMLARDGRVLLTDFGIAAIEGDSTITRTGELVGSIDYLAPERIRGEDPGPASDLWALGATLYTAVEERSPFRRTSPIGTLQAVVSEEPAPSYRAGALGPVVVALLRKEERERPTAAETERMLREAREGRAPLQAQAHVPTRRVTEDELRAVVPAQPTTPLPAHAPGTGPAPGAYGAPTGPVRTRGGTRGKVALTVLAAAVLGGGAVFGVLRLLDADDAGRGAEAAVGPVRTPQQDGGTAKDEGAGQGGDDEQDPKQDPGTDRTLPAGWRWERGDGFRLPVPQGWRRERSKENQYDYSPDGGRHRIRVNIDPSPDFDTPYRHLVDVEKGLSKRLPGFERLQLTEDVYRDRPSGLLEFTYTERTDHPGKRYALDRMHFGDGGAPEYAIYVTGPDGSRAETRARFRQVLRGWSTDG